MMDARVARWRSEVGSALTLLLFGLALWGLDRVLHDYPYGDIVRALHAMPVPLILFAALISAFGYLALIGYDFIAFRFAGLALPLRQMLVPSFVSAAVANTAPAAAVAAGGVRYRLYQPLGLTAGGAVKVAGFNVVTYALGLAQLAGVALLLGPAGAGPSGLALSGRALGTLLLSLVVAYIVLVSLGRGPLRLLGRTLPLPGFRLALAQLVLSAADWLLSSTALYVLLSGIAPVAYFAFLRTFLLAQFAALFLPIPAGVGVFEAVVLLLRPAGVAVPLTLAALLMYRVVYYLLPLVAAGALLAIRAVKQIRKADQPMRALFKSAAGLAPRTLAFTTFLAGVLLLVTGAIPADDRRLTWLAEVLPLTVIEVSHFLSSIVGAVLVLSAWGLERRSHFAYQLVRILFGAGILLTLLRSFDLRLAAFLALTLAVLALAGRQFARPDSLTREPMGSRWVFAAGAVFLVDVWIGVLLFRHAQFAGDVWWRFALFGHESRSLRAAVGVSIVMLLFAVERLISGSVPAIRRH